MKRLIPVVAFVRLIAWVGAAAAETQNEGVEITLGPEWKARFSPTSRKLTLLWFIREGDDAQNWKETLSIENTGPKGSSKFSLEKTLDNTKTYREKVCPGATTEWNVIEKNESSILYEFQSKPCLGDPEEHEIMRIITGTHNWFVLHYAVKGHELAPDTRAQVLKMFSAATVDSSASALVPSAWSAAVDEVVPFAMDKVLAAVKPAMEIKARHVTEATADRVECKRPRVMREGGGESVTAVLEAQGNQMRVRITTAKGFIGRLAKENWSNRVYEEMVRILQEAQ